MMNPTQRSLRLVMIAGLGLCSLVVACSGSSKSGRGAAGEPPAQTGDGTGNGDGTTKGTPPRPTSVAGDIGALSFKELDVELVGDFRIKKVEQDAKGHYYVAVTSDAKRAGGVGYAILKLDASGKEIWRFPTQEAVNAAVDAAGASADGSAHYITGSLSDMHVTAEGGVWLVGLFPSVVYLENLDAASLARIANEKEFNLLTSVPYGVAVVAPAEQPAVKRRLAGRVFLSQLDGAGLKADSPRVVKEQIRAVPYGWAPLAISLNPEGNVVIDAKSGAGPIVAQQRQILNPALTKAFASACYLAPGTNQPSGGLQLANVVHAASKPNVDQMTTPYILTMPLVATEPEAPAAILNYYLGSLGRCWDFMGTRIMPDADAAFRIVKPSVRAEGQPLELRVKSVSDLISGKATFEEYDVANGMKDTQQTPLRLLAVGKELVHLGLDELSNLVVGNGRQVEAKAWNADLLTTAMRSPGSTDMIASADAKTLLAAWTDLYQTGETNAGNRSLRLARIQVGGAAAANGSVKVERFSFVAPENFNFPSFTSVRLANASAGRTAVFATVGLSNAAASTSTGALATLIVGFAK